MSDFGVICREWRACTESWDQLEGVLLHVEDLMVELPGADRIEYAGHHDFHCGTIPDCLEGALARGPSPD